jgi:hypothetical protein
LDYPRIKKERDLMAKNTNCLEGMKCPQCGSLEPFRIETTTVMAWTDEGEAESANLEWEDDSYCECLECDYQGLVADFRTSPGHSTSLMGRMKNFIALVSQHTRDRELLPNGTEYVAAHDDAVAILDGIISMAREIDKDSTRRQS